MVVLVMVIVPLSAELAARVFFALQIGSSVWLYGIVPSATTHQTRWDEAIETRDREDMERAAGTSDYLKYEPHQGDRVTKIKVGTNPDGRPIWQEVTATINSHGFRGPEYETVKPPGTFRVVTLGASSTFGYRSRDDETYPVYLEQLLRERGDPARRFEVINLGIPHSNSTQIRNLFLAEGLALSPDVVTFYEGANDTRLFERPLLERWFLALSERSLLASYLGTLVGDRLETFSAADVQRYLHGGGEGFVANVRTVAEACAARGIRFLAITQQMHSSFLSPAELRATTYEQEVESIQKRVARGKRLNITRLQLLVHADINRQLRAWATASGTPLVDFVQILDAAGRRDLLLSWVHLDPLANQMLAEALADRIFELAPELRR
jgi:lysophospholipase L1-like esterase